MFLPLDCGGSIFGPCLVMHFLVLFLVFQSPLRGREKSIMSYLNCRPTIYDYVTAPHGAMGWSEVCNCGTA